jgi:hypothetical protein
MGYVISSSQQNEWPRSKVLPAYGHTDNAMSRVNTMRPEENVDPSSAIKVAAQRPLCGCRSATAPQWQVSGGHHPKIEHPITNK